MSTPSTPADGWTGVRVSFREPENGVTIIYTGTVREVIMSPFGDRVAQLVIDVDENPQARSPPRSQLSPAALTRLDSSPATSNNASSSNNNNSTNTSTNNNNNNNSSS